MRQVLRESWPFGSTQTIQSLSSRLQTPVLALYSPAWAGLYGATSQIIEGTYYLIQAGCVALLPPATRVAERSPGGILEIWPS